MVEPQTRPALMPTAASAVRKIRILIVDDEQMQRRVMSAILGRNQPDKEVVAAETRTEALRLYKEQRFDIVVSDKDMPGKDEGVQLLRELLAHDPSVKFILISGNIPPEQMREVKQLGAFEVFEKPVDRSALLQTISSALQQTPLAEPLMP